MTINEAAQLAGWPTTKSTDGDKGIRSPEGAAKEFARRGAGADLPTVVTQLAGWHTPDTTPDAPNAKSNCASPAGLGNQAKSVTAGWATPTLRDHKDGNCRDADVPVNALLGRQAVKLVEGADWIRSGQTQSSSTASTESDAASLLNPFFSSWLMGYPKDWVLAGIAALHKPKRK